MKTEYGISTKEKEISYLDFLDDILYSKLGFKPANSGTRYLRGLIIYIYKKNDYEYKVEKELKLFMMENNINTSFKTAKSKMVYALNNISKDKVEKNFYYVFKTEYNPYYLTIKNLVDSIINLMNRNFL